MELDGLLQCCCGLVSQREGFCPWLDVKSKRMIGDLHALETSKSIPMPWKPSFRMQQVRPPVPLKISKNKTDEKDDALSFTYPSAKRLAQASSLRDGLTSLNLRFLPVSKCLLRAASNFFLRSSTLGIADDEGFSQDTAGRGVCDPMGASCHSSAFLHLLLRVRPKALHTGMFATLTRITPFCIGTTMGKVIVKAHSISFRGIGI